MSDPIENRRPRASNDTVTRRGLFWLRGWLAKIPRPHRKPDTPAPPSALSGTLRLFRCAALWAVGALVVTATGAAFAESYQGLYEWAVHHGKTRVWGVLFPLQVDVFIGVGEIVLFIAMTDRWRRRDRAGAWTLALVGLAVSVAGNIGHEASHDLQSRGTAAVPPVAAFAALWIGLGVVKRVIGRPSADRPPAADEEPGRQPEAVALTTGEALRALLATNSIRGLAEELGVPKSRVETWKGRVSAPSAPKDYWGIDEVNGSGPDA